MSTGITKVFANTSVPFQRLLKYIEEGKTLDEFLRDFPDVTRETAILALEQVDVPVLGQIDRSSPKVADRPHPLTVGFNWITAVVSIIALVFSGYSWWLSKENTRILEEKSAPLVYSTEAELRKPLAADSTLYVAFYLKNQGETPAYKIVTHYNIKLLPKDQKLVEDYKGGDCNLEEKLASQDWTRINFIGEKLSDEEVNRIGKGDLTLWLFGKTEYEDSLKIKHPLDWCWKYKPDLNEFWRCDSGCD